MTTPARLHWGCGPNVIDGWVNVDAQDFGQQYLHDITNGPLPFPDGTFDYAVVNHALQEVGYHQLVSALAELRRVLVKGGTLRLIEPDLALATETARGGTAGWLGDLIDDQVERSIAGKLCAWVTFYSHRRSIFTGPWLVELCMRAGFAHAVHIGERHHTATKHDEIVALDSRWAESCVVEATR